MPCCRRPRRARCLREIVSQLMAQAADGGEKGPTPRESEEMIRHVLNHGAVVGLRMPEGDEEARRRGEPAGRVRGQRRRRGPGGPDVSGVPETNGGTRRAHRQSRRAWGPQGDCRSAIAGATGLKATIWSSSLATTKRRLKA